MTTLTAACNATSCQGRCDANRYAAHELGLRLHPRWPQPHREQAGARTHRDPTAQTG